MHIRKRTKIIESEFKGWKCQCSKCCFPKLLIPRDKDLQLMADKVFCPSCGHEFTLEVEDLESFEIRQWREKDEYLLNEMRFK